MKLRRFALATLTLATVMATGASAHVVVKPGDVATGSFQTFTMGVPNEKGGSVVKVKLLIPEGMQFVTPTVKQGWTIETEKTGEGEEAVVKSITWSGGAIGGGLRDDFTFSGKTPDEPTKLEWKAYETYDNGVTVAWDQTAEEAKDSDFSKSGPFSVTNVTANGGEAAAGTAPVSSSSDTVAKTLGGAALVVSVLAFALALRKKA